MPRKLTDNSHVRKYLRDLDFHAKRTNDAARKLLKFRQKNFGRVVNIESESFKGVGIVVCAMGCPPNMVPILHDTGVTHLHALSSLTHFISPERAPEWTRDKWLTDAMKRYRPLK